ncbi:unnamed protein product, partial [Mesorhabditis spiculigera]
MHSATASPYSEPTPAEAECLEHYENNLQTHKDERDSIQKKTFTKWVNKHLNKADHRAIDDLFEGLRDGLNLIYLLEALTGHRIPREKSVKTQFHRVQNVQNCLTYLRERSIRLVNIRAEDIEEGNGKLTLGLIWTIILNFQVSQVHRPKHENGNGNADTLQTYEAVHGNATGKTAREALLEWAQEATDGYPQVRVSNFGSSWRDGLAFNAILHRYRPHLVQWSHVISSGRSNLERLEHAFALAEREFGVTRLMDPEDFESTNVDEKSVITYVSSLHNALPPLPELSKFWHECLLASVRLQRIESEYIHEAQSWLTWVHDTTEAADCRLFVGTPEGLWAEVEQLRAVHLPQKADELEKLEHIYAGLLEQIGADKIEIEHELQGPALRAQWLALNAAIDRRQALLDERAHAQTNTSDLLSRLKRGCEIVGEKLDIVLVDIESLEKVLERLPPSELERKINQLLDALTQLSDPIELLDKDVDELDALRHPDAVFYRKKVVALEQRRQQYIERLKFRIADRLAARTETIRLEQSRRTEAARASSFSRVEEAIRWVREYSDRIHRIHFVDGLELLEEAFDQHKIDNRDIQDYRQSVDQCIARQNDVSAEDTHTYYNLLRSLESEYQQLRDYSAGRMLDLDSLIAFVRAAQIELCWLSEREEIEVTRDWGDVDRLDLPVLQNHSKKLRHEMELREKQFTEVHNRGAALVNQGHPAVEVIEGYLRTMTTQWDWLRGLTHALDVHLKDALDYKTILEEAKLTEQRLDEQLQQLSSSYSATDYGPEDGERELNELQRIKDILNKYNNTVQQLAEQAKHISPLWQRNERIQRPQPVQALIDYDTIRSGDQVSLVDSADTIRWMVRDVTRKEVAVPSVVFRLPPPDTKLNTRIARMIQRTEALGQLWAQKHRHVRYHMFTNTMATIQTWDIEQFEGFDEERRAQVIGALDDDIRRLIAELGPNDPLTLKLRAELRATKDAFRQLEHRAQRTPEPDFSEQFDQQIAFALRRLDDSWRTLIERVGRPVDRSKEQLEKSLLEHKQFEESLQALDPEVASLKSLYQQLNDPTTAQRLNHEKLDDLWENLWDLAKMYVARIKVLESVLLGIEQFSDIVKTHEVALCSQDDLPADVPVLTREHAGLVERKMILNQQQSLLDALNQKVAHLRQHVIRTRRDVSSHPDVDRVEEDAQQLNVRWDNVGNQVVDRLDTQERNLQLMLVFRTEIEHEFSWLNKVERTISELRRPEELSADRIQDQLDVLAAEYSQLQERTVQIEHLNREGGKYIRDAKSHDLRLDQYIDSVTRVHGSGIRASFSRSEPQPKNGARTISEELDQLNKRFAQLCSLILEKQNKVQIVVQTFKRKQQEEAVRECLEKQKELNSAISDLSNFEQTIYTTKLNIQLDQQRPEEGVQGIEGVKASLDEWAARVRQQLETADRLCSEQADQLPPEQYALLRQKRDQLAETYEATVRNVEGIYDRLHEVTRLLIEFSSESSAVQSWITDATRRAGDIKAESADPSQVAEQRQRTKQLQDEVVPGEAKLKKIGSIVAKIEAELAAMHESAPQIQVAGLSGDEVKRTLYRVEDDYHELLRQCQDLGSFQNRVAALGNDLNERAGRADNWLRSLEDQLNELFGKGRPVEERLRMADEMNRRVANEQSRLDDAEQAAKKLLGVLEGMPGYEDVKEKQEREQSERRRRHSFVVEQLQKAMNEATAEQAIAEGVRDAVEGLVSWADDLAKKSEQSRAIPLKEDTLAALRNEDHLLNTEADAKGALAQQLETEVRKLSDTNPALAKHVEGQLAEAKRKLGKANTELRGFRDNVDDAIGGLRDLGHRTELIGRHSDALMGQVKPIPPKDQQRLVEAEQAVKALGQEAIEAATVMNRLLSIPHVTDTADAEKMMTEAGAKVDAVAELVQDKLRKAKDLDQLDIEFNAKKAEFEKWLNRAEDEAAAIGPLKTSAEELKEQKKECAELIDRLPEGQPNLEALERMSMAIAELETVPGSRASSVPRNVMDLRSRYDQLGSSLQDRSDRIGEQLDKTAQLEGQAEAVHRWIAEQRARLANELPLELNDNAVKAARDKLEKIEKDSRQGQRQMDEVRMQARELARTNAEAGRTIGQLERALDLEWEALQTGQDAARKRIDQAEKVVDRLGQLDRWIGGKQRLVDALPAPSTEPHEAKGLRNHIDMLKLDADNEQSSLDQVSNLAEKLLNEAENEADKEAIRNRMEELKKRWGSLGQSLDSRDEQARSAAHLGADIQQLDRQIKKSLHDLEREVDAASRLPSNEIEKQLALLDSLKQREGSVEELIDALAEKEAEAGSIGIDAGNRAEIADITQGNRTKAAELDKKIDSVKQAALTVRGEGDALEKRLDALLGDVQLAALEVNNAPPICADPTKLAEAMGRFEKVYSGVLGREGDVSLVRAKVQEQLLNNPEAKPELRAKLDRLDKEWPPLLEATKEKRNALDKANELVKQFKDAEKTLKQHLEDEEKELAKAIEAALGEDNPTDAFRPLEASIDRRVNEAEALDGLAEKIEKTAPGPDARHLKRGAENLLDDVRAHGKKARTALQVAQKKADLHARFKRLADEAYGLCAAREADLDRDQGHLNRERLQAKLSEVEAYWAKTGRELKQLSDELSTILPEEQAEQTRETADELEGLFENLVDKMRSVDGKLAEKKDEAERAREKTNRLATRLNSLYSDLNDLEPIGRSAEELERQRGQCEEMESELGERDKELADVEALWEAAIKHDAITPEQFDNNQQHVDDLKRLIGKGKRKLGDRHKKINAIGEEVARVESEANAVINDIHQLQESPALQSDNGLSEPKAQAEALRQLKEQLKPTAERAKAVQGECKALIKSAAPEADTKQLSQILQDVSKALGDVDAQIGARQLAVDAAVQQMGSYNDAQRDLQNWLEETEELVDNQKLPSADAKVARAQLQSYDVILKHIEDKQASVDGFQQMIGKLAALTSDADEKRALSAKADEITGRYEELLDGAQRGQARLRDAVDLAEKLGKELGPFEQWIGSTEKRISQLGKLPTDTERLVAQVRDVEAIQDDIDGKIEAVQKLCQLGPRLAALVSVEEAGALEAQLTAATAKHGQLADRTEQCRIGLEAMAEQVSNFEQDVEALAEWLTAIEQDMADVEELPINPDELLEQTNLLSELVENVTEKDALVSSVCQVGKELCREAAAEDALALQAHVEKLKHRYIRVAGCADEKLALLTRAIPLSDQFHDGYDGVMAWVEAVEADLHQADGFDIDTQQQLIHSLEIDIQEWRPEAEVAMQLSDEVSQLCKERTEILGQTLAHVDEIGHSFEDMNRWLDEVERDLAGQPSVTTATPSHELAKQQQHNLELSAVIAAQTPLVERFEYNVNSLAELVGPADVQALRQIYDQIVGRYNDVKNQVKSRGEAIDSILDATEAFGDRLDVFLATLEGAAESLRQPAAVSADPGLLQNRIAENEALLDSLREKEAALDAMKERANELLARAQPGDAAASEVAAKIQALDQLWGEIGRGAEMRGAFLNDALAKAHQFWAELDDCQKAIDDLKARLETLEPAIGQPERLREQQQGLTDIDGALFSDKSLHLGKAMEEAMQFHDDLSALHEFLEAAEQRLHSMGPAENVAVEEIQPKLEELQLFRAELDDHAVLKEEVNQKAHGLTIGRPAHQTAAVRVPIAELNGRWSKLYGDIADREHKIERAMLEMGRLGEAQLEHAQGETDSWLESAKDLEFWMAEMGIRLDEEAPGSANHQKLLEWRDEAKEAQAELTAKRPEYEAIEAAADARAEALRKAMEQAEDFDAKAHGLLAWMDGLDDRLKAAGKEPNLDKAIPAAQAVLDELKAEEARKEVVLARGQDILQKAHPNAEQPMRHWNRLLAARWKEVEDQALEKVADLKEQRQKSEEREKAIKELITFVTKKRGELGDMIAAPTPEDLDTVDRMLQDYELLDFELREKQPDVEETIQGGQKDKNPRASQLSDEWKRVWLDAMGHKNALDEAKEMLEEMKRLEGWEWEDWKERYCDWNDHAKGRVTDLFRRIDRTATGNVPRQAFIDAIINSRFPTSRLEMEKVADLFDNNGFINHKDFTNALRFDKTRRVEPRTDGERIAVEIERQVRGCSCCQPYKIERIAEGQYRFGDTQIKRMVRILRSTVMVRVGGGWVCLEEFLKSHDPCRATKRRNDVLNNLRGSNERIIRDSMEMFTKNRHARFGSSDSEPQFAVPGPIIKIREKTERSMPMFPGQHRPGGSAHSSNSRLRTPSDVSLGDSRIGKGWPGNSPFGSQQSLDKGSRPPSRASESGPDKPTRIPSLRGKKGVRYNPPRQL